MIGGDRCFGVQDLFSGWFASKNLVNKSRVTFGSSENTLDEKGAGCSAGIAAISTFLGYGS